MCVYFVLPFTFKVRKYIDSIFIAFNKYIYNGIMVIIKYDIAILPASLCLVCLLFVLRMLNFLLFVIVFYFRSIMPFYGEIYFRAWRNAIGPNLEVWPLHLPCMGTWRTSFGILHSFHNISQEFGES